MYEGVQPAVDTAEEAAPLRLEARARKRTLDDTAAPDSDKDDEEEKDEKDEEEKDDDDDDGDDDDDDDDEEEEEDEEEDDDDDAAKNAAETQAEVGVHWMYDGWPAAVGDGVRHHPSSEDGRKAPLKLHALPTGQGKHSGFASWPAASSSAGLMSEVHTFATKLLLASTRPESVHTSWSVSTPTDCSVASDG